MKPITAGILTSPVVNTNAKTPPIRANGRFNKIMPLCFALRNSLNNSKKIITIDIKEVSSKVREAACSLSNCPPYST